MTCGPHVVSCRRRVRRRNVAGDQVDEERGAIAFGQRLLALLDTGSFTTSYKYALLLAILDATLEGTDAAGRPPQALHATDLGRRVFATYWTQARPFGDGGLLRQSKQRDLLVKIAELRAELSLPAGMPLEVARSRFPSEVDQLERDAVATVVRYPVPLLQRHGRRTGAHDEFLYRCPWTDGITPGRMRRPDFDDQLPLQLGVGQHLTALAGLVRPVIERAWLHHVARRNDDQVEELQLESFLFGASRVSLTPVRDPLLELQRGRCFYCDGERGPWDVDHFLPWSRWPDDRLDNLVVAHRRCNNAKRDALAAVDHLAAWWRRANDGPPDRHLEQVASATGWPRRTNRTLAAARGIYLHQPAGTVVWSGVERFEPLDLDAARAVLLSTGLDLAAEGERPGPFT